MQTCAMAIQKETFDFVKLPCVVFCGEDAAHLGGPRREFFKEHLTSIFLYLFSKRMHNLMKIKKKVSKSMKSS